MVVEQKKRKAGDVADRCQLQRAAIHQSGAAVSSTPSIRPPPAATDKPNDAMLYSILTGGDGAQRFRPGVRGARSTDQRVGRQRRRRRSQLGSKHAAVWRRWRQEVVVRQRMPQR